MTTPLNMTSQEIPARDRSAPRSQRAWLWLVIKIGVVVLAIGTGLRLLWSPSPEPTAAVPKTEPSQNAAVVQLAGPRLIAVQAGSLLEKKLAIVPASREQIATPVLTVTGAVVARLRAELTAQTKVVERLRKLVAAGTEAIKDLAAEEATLLQTQLEGQKAVFEAEAAVRVATRNRAALERQLFQTGVDPHLLERAPEGATIVMADVPEARVGLVAAGQACEARFYGFPEMVFPGKVSSLAPTLSGERRTLRVFFELNDRQGRLKPGMYAEIGLGTDSRQTVLLPADGVLHVGRSDYVLVEAEPGVWRVTEVKVGEQDGTRVEILDGLQGGERVIGSGAILLKPVVAQAVLQS